MHARTAARTVSAAAFAGGLTFGMGVMSPASAVPPTQERPPSVGHLCQQAVRGLVVTEEGEIAPSLVDGLPGLRCGQVFGSGRALGLTEAEESEEPVDEEPVTDEVEEDPVTEEVEEEPGTEEPVEEEAGPQPQVGAFSGDDTETDEAGSAWSNGPRGYGHRGNSHAQAGHPGNSHHAHKPGR